MSAGGNAASFSHPDLLGQFCAFMCVVAALSVGGKEVTGGSGLG